MEGKLSAGKTNYDLMRVPSPPARSHPMGEGEIMGTVSPDLTG